MTGVSVSPLVVAWQQLQEVRLDLKQQQEQKQNHQGVMRAYVNGWEYDLVDVGRQVR